MENRDVVATDENLQKTLTVHQEGASARTETTKQTQQRLHVPVSAELRAVLHPSIWAAVVLWFPWEMEETEDSDCGEMKFPAQL